MRAPLLPVALLAACAVPPRGGAVLDDVRTPDGRTAARIVRLPHDPERHQETSKVFHHVFAPDGRLLTKGTGGRYGHHRGLFLGWSRTSWRGTTLDFWHMNRGESQRFRGFAPAPELGPDWQVARIEWRAADGEVVAREERALRARSLGPDVTALDLEVELRAAGSPLRLDGDPQHAGQQFRALQRFAEEGGPRVRYVRPPAAVGHDDDVWTGCGWIAAVLHLGGGPVTVLRIEDPANPGPATWSTRPYGRFGATFAVDLPGDGRLVARWIYVLALGERDAAWCAATADQQLLGDQSSAAGRRWSTSWR